MNVSPFFSFLAEKKSPGKAACLRELGWKHAVTEPAFRTRLSPGPAPGQWECASWLPMQTSQVRIWPGEVTQSCTREEPKQPPKQLTCCGFPNKLGFSLFSPGKACQSVACSGTGRQAQGQPLQCRCSSPSQVCSYRAPHFQKKFDYTTSVPLTLLVKVLEGFKISLLEELKQNQGMDFYLFSSIMHALSVS